MCALMSSRLERAYKYITEPSSIATAPSSPACFKDLKELLSQFLNGFKDQLSN